MAPRAKQEEMMIVNRRTGKALQSTGPDDGQLVEQAAPNGSDAQLWTAVKEGKAVKLVNKASGKVLDVMHGGTEAGTWTQIWEDVGGDSQLWQWVKVTATYKKLMNVQSGKVLDIVDMREDDGAPTQIWDDVEGEGQQWKLVAPTDGKVSVRKGAAKKAEAKKDAEPAKDEEAVKPASKKRGRKPKAKPAVEGAAEVVEAAGGEAAPKKRGRKPKAAAEKAATKRTTRKRTPKEPKEEN